MKHTPGPWEASYDEKRDQWQIWRNSKEWGKSCWIANMKMGEETLNIEATANLIAAAPDLLEAAKKIIETIPFIVSGRQSGKTTTAEAVRMLGVAIAKAEGRDAEIFEKKGEK